MANKTKLLNLPDNISVTINEADRSSVAFEPGTMLSGWDQDFAATDHIYNTGDMEVIRIFVERESVFVAYLFKDKFKKYLEYNAQPAVKELKEYFYDNLQSSLRKKFKVKKKDLSIIIVPRYAELAGLVSPTNVHPHDTSEVVNPIACEVQYTEEGGANRFRGRKFSSKKRSRNKKRSSSSTRNKKY